MNVLELDAHLQKHLPAQDAFGWLLNCDGKVHREVKHRRTAEFTLGGRHYFIKIHRDCGWGEIFKDLFQARLPVVSARSEWEALERLHFLGIPTMVVAAKGLRGWNPARLESFVVTEALEGMISLEHLLVNWGSLTGERQQKLKRALIEQIARMARTLHENGINHRDFYIPHFLVKNRDWSAWDFDQPLEVFLIDLHRAQLRARVPTRWKVKDLASLLFSSLDFGLTRRDLWRFVNLYHGRSWRRLGADEKRMWRRVWHQARELYLDFYRKPPPRVA
jgi:heptose I phosphotransferase